MLCLVLFGHLPAGLPTAHPHFPESRGVNEQLQWDRVDVSGQGRCMAAWAEHFLPRERSNACLGGSMLWGVAGEH